MRTEFFKVSLVQRKNIFTSSQRKEALNRLVMSHRKVFELWSFVNGGTSYIIYHLENVK